MPAIPEESPLLTLPQIIEMIDKRLCDLEKSVIAADVRFDEVFDILDRDDLDPAMSEADQGANISNTSNTSNTNANANQLSVDTDE
jgi:hypothetical protein